MYIKLLYRNGILCSLYSTPDCLLNFPFQVVTVPFPFQSLMKLLLVSVTSGLLLYASPGIAAALLPRPLKVDEMYLFLLATMGISIIIPLLFRLIFVSRTYVYNTDD